MYACLETHLYSTSKESIKQKLNITLKGVWALIGPVSLYFKPVSYTRSRICLSHKQKCPKMTNIPIMTNIFILYYKTKILFLPSIFHKLFLLLLNTIHNIYDSFKQKHMGIIVLCD